MNLPPRMSTKYGMSISGVVFDPDLEFRGPDIATPCQNGNFLHFMKLFDIICDDTPTM